MFWRAAGRLRIRKLRGASAAWLQTAVAAWPPAQRSAVFDEIDAAAAVTQALGKKPLWSGYAALRDYPFAVGTDAMRSSEEVRTKRENGEFFAWLAERRRPRVVVEFGTAFGVSGMYWLAGLAAAGQGRLFTFEPNQLWAEIARGNLDRIGGRYTLVPGTFEDNVDKVEGPIDVAFIDAIHTSAFVDAQLALILARAAPGAIILLDDIDFSADMRRCWRRIARDPRFVAAYEVGRCGVVELAAA
jgi:predicted O-methyltransferase YrrM